MQKAIRYPVPDKRPFSLTHHNDTRVDPYYWLRDKDNQEVINHLEAENEVIESYFAGRSPSREQLYRELRSLIKEDDRSVPYLYAGFEYYSEVAAGEQYRRYYRKLPGHDQTPELLLDLNHLAESCDYLDLGSFEPSPNGRYLGYSIDTKGDETYTILIKDLQTGKLLADTIANTFGDFVWTADQSAFYYTVLNELHRPVKVFLHRLGTEIASDQLIYEEKDSRFFVNCTHSRSREFVFINCFGNNMSEIYAIAATGDPLNLRCLKPRMEDVEYYVDHHKDNFLFLTNAQGATNFKVMRLPTQSTNWREWQEFVPASTTRHICDLAAFEQFVIVKFQENGLPHIHALDANGATVSQVMVDEQVYTLNLTTNFEYVSDTVRYVYSSLTTPETTFDFSPATGSSQLIKVRPLGVAYDHTRYRTQRLWARSHDGTQVPISLVYRRDLVSEGTPAPVFLTAYGSYGSSYDPHFSSHRLTLLDRGFIHAIAHVRGGEDLGRSWYENGKLTSKWNTFKDFISCSEFLIKESWTTANQLFVSGGSAGGLLMGVIANERPELFRAIIAQVPFVDTLTTMLDESLPLTTIEYNEWGNPNDKKFYDYIKSYSPYDNVCRQRYPDMYVSAGLNDTRVTYWEPAKWVAKLRDHDEGHATILLRTHMGAGHSGATGRYEHLRETAELISFVLSLTNQSNETTS